MPPTPSFWSYQLRTAWKNTGSMSLPARTRAVAQFARQIVSRHHSASGSPLAGGSVPAEDRLTVIVLNHKRPQNVGQIAQYVLRNGFVGRLVVSNNSQAYAIGDHVKVRDPRLVLIDQPEPSGVGISLELARQYPSRYYLRIDDDIFLHPVQLQWVYWNLRHASDRPHGIFGASFTPAKNPAVEWPFVHTRNASAPVDILNGLFAFTSRHLDEYFRLCARLGIHDQRALMNGEDIVLSFSGTHKPMVHHVGPIWECASEASPGVALHQSRPRFYEERWQMYEALREFKPLARDAD